MSTKKDPTQKEKIEILCKAFGLNTKEELLEELINYRYNWLITEDPK